MILNTVKTTTHFIRLVFVLGAFAFGVFAAGSSAAEEPTPKSQAEIEKIIRTYLLANPEILNEMIAELKRRAKDTQNTQAQSAIEENKALLIGESAPIATVLGNPDGPITLVEFSDYNCGFCKRFYTSLTTLISENQDVRVVVKEFPILAESSLDAARAALAAGMQGKYTEFHDSLMTSRQNITQALLERIAGDLELDIEMWRTDQLGPDVQAELAMNQKLTEEIGLTGTPALIIGDELIRGFVPVETLRDLVKTARK